jgi:hypothetical protein
LVLPVHRRVNEVSLKQYWRLLYSDFEEVSDKYYFSTLYQERAVFGKVKMDPAKRAQTQNAGEVS